MATTAAPPTTEKLYLDGEWIDTGDHLDVRSPYSGEIVATVARAGADEARRAVDAAARAMREPLAPWERADILERVSALIKERQRGARAHDLRPRPASRSRQPGSRPPGR